jgi:hypothetical protein
MTKLEDIEKAILALSGDELAKLRDWFEELQADLFDQQIERDAKAGKLDRLADEALAHHKAGRTREL